ncbi:unnamed protein product, partial [Orchesella dallaii]
STDCDSESGFYRSKDQCTACVQAHNCVYIVNGNRGICITKFQSRTIERIGRKSSDFKIWHPIASKKKAFLTAKQCQDGS